MRRKTTRYFTASRFIRRDDSMGILGKIFESGDVIKSGIDLIDSFHTSTEEEIAAKTKDKVDIIPQTLTNLIVL